MNITNNINRNNFNMYKTDNEILKSLGFKNFSRKIYFFIKEVDNLYNIEGNKLVTKIGCLITNRSISCVDKSTNYNKTVYLCDVEFPKEYNIETIKRDFNKFVDIVDITPLYAFANNHIITNENKFFNYGLTLVDLSISNHNSFGIINFADRTNESLPTFKEIIYGNQYNPKYYMVSDAKAHEDEQELRNGKVEHFFDSNTKILCNKYGSENVDNFINGVEQKGIFIDKRTMCINELITAFFNKYMFLQFDDIEIIYNSQLSKPLNIKKLTTFAEFTNDAKTYYIDQLLTDIEHLLENFKNELKEDFYLVLSITDQFVIADVYFFNDNRKIRITKPLYKLYGEFALDSEQMLNCIESDADIAKCDMLEQVSRDIQGIEFVRDISGAINLIDNATKSILLAMEENKENARNLIQGNNICLLEDDRD